MRGGFSGHLKITDLHKKRKKWLLKERVQFETKHTSALCVVVLFANSSTLQIQWMVVFFKKKNYFVITIYFVSIAIVNCSFFFFINNFLIDIFWNPTNKKKKERKLSLWNNFYENKERKFLEEKRKDIFWNIPETLGNPCQNFFHCFFSMVFLLKACVHRLPTFQKIIQEISSKKRFSKKKLMKRNESFVGLTLYNLFQRLYLHIHKKKSSLNDILYLLVGSWRTFTFNFLWSILKKKIYIKKWSHFLFLKEIIVQNLKY